MEERVKKNIYNQGQTLIGIIIVLIIVALFSGGLYYYLSRQTPEISQNTQKPNEEVAKSPDATSSPEEEKPTPSPEEEKPIVQKCSDGTLYGQCSTNKPKYCDNGNLIDKCVTCNCPSNKTCKISGSCETAIACQDECSQIGSKKCSNNGYQTCGNYDADNCLEWSSITNCLSNTICQNGSCIQQKCSDGTLYSQCSTNKPKYCNNGNLVNTCSLCSCPSGTICENNECIQAIDTSGPTPLSGSLNLLLNTSYLNQSVTAPQSNFKLADFSLTNNTTETINLKTIQVDLATGSDLYITNLYVTNLYVVYGSNKTAIFDHVVHNNYWSINFQLLVGQSIDLSVYGDVNSSIPFNSIIHSSVLVRGVTTVSAVAVNTNLSAVLSGQDIKFGVGSLTVSTDSLTPPTRIVAANQRIVAGKFQFEAAYDFYAISELKFVMPTPLAVSMISGAVLSDSATGVLLTPKPISVSYDGNYYFFDFNINVPVTLNSSISLTLYFDLKADIDSHSTNINIAPILAYIKATNSRGTLMDGAAGWYNNFIVSYHGITLPPGGVWAKDIFIFKSIPTFTAVSSNTSVLNGSNINLYTFSIGADPNGDISVKQLMFTITITDPNKSYPRLSNFTFFKGTIDYSNSVNIGNIVSNDYIYWLKGNGYIEVRTNTVVLIFNEEETIPAGKTQTYTLKAYADYYAKSAASGSYSVSTLIPPDYYKFNIGRYLRMANTNIYGLSQAPQDIAVVDYNLLWSDKSALFPPHNAQNGYSTNDWYDGLWVLNFPLPTQTIITK